MEEEYFLDGKVYVDKRVGMFVKAEGKLYKRGELGFVDRSSPWQRVYVDKIIRKGNTVFIVSYICKNNRDGKDEASRLFLKENDAEKYISFLGKAICSKYNCEEAHLSYTRFTSFNSSSLSIFYNFLFNFKIFIFDRNSLN